MSIESIETNVVENLKRGEFVRRLDKCGMPQKKVFIRGDFERTTQRYSLVDAEDTNRECFVKKGTKLNVGFTY